MNADLLKKMGNRLSARRKQLGITQEQLAERMNVSIQMISNMELGKKAIRPENLIKVCEILDISSDYILTGKKSEREMNSIIYKLENLSDREIGLVETMLDYLLHNK